MPLKFCIYYLSKINLCNFPVTFTPIYMMLSPQSVGVGYIPLLNISLNNVFKYGSILVKVSFSISMQIENGRMYTFCTINNFLLSNWSFQVFALVILN